MNAKILGTLLAAGISAVASAGNIWWVDQKTGANGEGRGKSESAAFLTIQAAVNAAASGDEIRVKPGVYDEGSGYYNSWNNRVLVQSKVLKIVSTGGKEVTHIVGGPNIRCVCMVDARGSVVEGFTIRDGEATYFQSGTDTVNGSGAGVLGISASKTYATANGCIVDCVVSNCVAIRGGGMRGITAVRCWITENDASNSGPAGRKCDFVNCLITRNYTTQCIHDGCKAVNCTIVDNMRGAAENVSLFNSVMHNNSNGTVDERNIYPGTLINHCVTRVEGFAAFKETSQPVDSFTNSLPYQFIAPLYDDFRVLKGSETEFAGDASLIASAGIEVPDGVDMFKDLYGNTIPSSGTIAAGCIQTVVTPQGGGIVFDNRRNILSRGKMALAKHLYAFAETWPTQFTVQAVNKGNPAIFAFLLGETYVFPTMDDTIHIVPPAASDTVTTCGVKAATATYYVDPVKGSDDTASGNDPETPYLTLKAAIDKCGNTLGRVVRAAEGDYKAGETHSGGVSNRLYMNSYGLRVIGAGAGKSVIWGAPDPATGGMGANATRCIFSNSTRACVQGFTLRDGYAVGTKTGDYPNQRGGGVYMSSTSYNTSLHILDCVITNCWAYRGGAGYSGSYERCHITGCGADNGVMRYAQLLSCVVDNLPGSEMASLGANNVYGRAYNTTFVGRNTEEYVINRYSDAVTNCIVMTTKELGLTKVSGTFAWNVPSCSNTVTVEDPKLVDAAGGDYRPMHYYRRKRLYSVSPVFGAGVWYNLPSINMTDFEGKPLNLIGGNPTVGAYQWPHSVYETPGLIVTFK